MATKEKKTTVHRAKKTAAVSAVALLTAASVMTGSLFDSPSALLPEDGGSAVVYNMTTGLDGADDDDAGVNEDESEETRRRGGIRAVLRARILRLPLWVRLVVLLPLWALGSAILAAAGAAWGLLSPVMGRVAGFALLLALLVGAFVLAAKAVFPDLPVKKLLSRRSLVALLLGAAALSVADAVLGATWADYEQAKDVVLSVGFFAALSCAAVPFALREQKRRLAARPERPKQPDKLVFTDASGSLIATIPNPNA